MRRTLTFAMALTLVACGGGSGTTAQPNTVSRPIRGPADFISEAEIAAGVYQNGMDIVQKLRPSMLRPRGTSSSQYQVVLYLDDVKMLDLNGLSTIPAERVKEIRYINARDATTRWGTGHGSGVILVTSKR